MVKQALIELFERDLNKLKDELNLYKDESSLWVIKEGINNSAGNLCLHLSGNLNHFIGTILGNTGYVRNRDAEFALKNIPRKELTDGIDNTVKVVTDTLRKLTDDDMQKIYPFDKFGKEITTDYMMLHLFGHLSYHLGQVNYHRRLTMGS